MSLPTFGAGNRLQEAARLLQSGDAGNAIALLEQEIQENPNNGPAFQCLGVARSQIGDVGGGIIALRDAARLMPQNSAVLYNLGVALAQARQTDEATAVLKKALSLDPANTKVRQALERLGVALPTPASAPVAAPRPATPVSGFDLGLDIPTTPPSYTPTPVAAPLPPAPTPMGLGTIGGGYVPPAAPAPVVANVPSGPTLTPTNLGGQQFYGGPLPTASATGMGSDAVAGGMYVPPAAITPQMMGREPNLQERILRGLGWGAVWAQWWTLWWCFWNVFFYPLTSGQFSPLLAIAVVTVCAIVMALVGLVLGLVIALLNASEDTGATIGIGFGLVLFGLVMWRFGGSFFNAIFWFFTGRYIGQNIARRIHQLIGV